jgi:hypothetical protein
MKDHIVRRFHILTSALLLTVLLANCKYPTGDNNDMSGNSKEPQTNCLGFFACGGDISGTWMVDSMCLNDDLSTELLSELNLPSECSEFFQNATVSTTGTLTYANDNETAKLTETLAITVEYTDLCLSALVGQTTLMDLSACNDMQNQLATRADVRAVTCSLVGTTCMCSLTEKRVIDTLTGYVANGTSLAYITGDSADYCVSDSTLTLRKTGLVGSLSGTIYARR